MGRRAVKKILRAGPLLNLGWAVALATLTPLGIGILLDRRFDTAPLFILIGALVGIMAGTVSAVRIAGRAIDAIGNLGEDAEDSDVNRLERGKEDRA